MGNGKTITIYICNRCGMEHDYKQDAIECHPDIVEKEVPIIEYKARSGEIVRRRNDS